MRSWESAHLPKKVGRGSDSQDLMDQGLFYRNRVSKRLSQRDLTNVDIGTRELFPIRYPHLIDKDMRRNKERAYILIKPDQNSLYPLNPLISEHSLLAGMTSIW